MTARATEKREREREREREWRRGTKDKRCQKRIILKERNEVTKEFIRVHVEPNNYEVRTESNRKVNIFRRSRRKKVGSIIC